MDNKFNLASVVINIGPYFITDMNSDDGEISFSNAQIAKGVSTTSGRVKWVFTNNNLTEVTLKVNANTQHSQLIALMALQPRLNILAAGPTSFTCQCPSPFEWITGNCVLKQTPTTTLKNFEFPTKEFKFDLEVFV